MRRRPKLTCSLRLPTRFTLVYGGLVYQLLGDKAESAFARDWGVGLAIDHASQWKSVLQSSLEAAVILTIMDRLSLVPGSKWLEVHLDQWSVQATLFHGQAVGQVERIKQYLAHTARIEKK